MGRKQYQKTMAFAVRPFAVVLALLAGVMLWWGGELALLGGSIYYVLSGILLLASAVMLWRGRVLGAWLYALFWVATLAWSVWECGSDGWALLARLGLPTGMGLWLLLPFVQRALSGSYPGASRGPVASLSLASIVAILAGGGLHMLRSDPVDPVYQQGMADQAALASAELPEAGINTDGDWMAFGNDPGGSRFSGLDQINTGNVGQLEVAWTARVGSTNMRHTPNFQSTAVKVGELVYICKPNNEVVALDASSGTIRWRNDLRTDDSGLTATATCRGVSYYRVPGAEGACAQRIYTNTIDARLIAMDALDGKPCRDFGTNGQVSLLKGLGTFDKGYYYTSSPPAVVRGKLVLGGWISDNQYVGQPSGVIRAFDAVTGTFAWAFDVGRLDRQSEPPEGETYTPNTPNSWAPMSSDEEMGLVYAPTGNAVPDNYGAQRRPFDDEFSSSVVAIDAETGKLRWSFRTTHHDLWDYDVPSQPTLADIRTPEGLLKLMVVGTKRGEMFVLDRATGKPLKRVTERKVPTAGAVPEERVSPTQPFSDGIPSVAGPDLTESRMWGLTSIDHLWCRREFRRSRWEGTMTPPALNKQTLVNPGYAGGNNWSSVSIDPERGIMVAPALYIPNLVTLITRKDADARGLKPQSDGSGGHGVGGAAAQANTPYGVLIAPFLSPLGIPCTQPPYAKLTAVDLVRGKLVWTRAFGTAAKSGPMGLRSHIPLTIGPPSWGGAIVTRGGLTFISGSQDQHVRAFDTVTGKELWRGKLPAGGQATPSTYMTAEGRQILLVVAGGGPIVQAKVGDYIVAYALPVEP